MYAMSPRWSALAWRWFRSPSWLLIVALTTVLLCLSCSPGSWVSRGAYFQPQPSWDGPLTGGRSQLNQSCGAACAAPVNPSTGELLAPAATRLGPVVGKAAQAVEVLQGLLTFERLLTEAELDEVQTVFKECVAQAHADVNAAYQREGGFKFKNGKFPNDAECDRTMGVDEKGNPIKLSQELGTLKHAAAFACIKERLPEELRGNFSIEPRYRGDAKVNGTVLTNNKPGSLKPDVVVHATRNATQVQCVYEFKFPCDERHRLDPMNSPGVEAQLEGYKYLSKSCRVVLVTPDGLNPLGG